MGLRQAKLPDAPLPHRHRITRLSASGAHRQEGERQVGCRGCPCLQRRAHGQTEGIGEAVRDERGPEIAVARRPLIEGKGREAGGELDGRRQEGIVQPGIEEGRHGAGDHGRHATLYEELIQPSPEEEGFGHGDDEDEQGAGDKRAKPPPEAAPEQHKLLRQRLALAESQVRSQQREGPQEEILGQIHAEPPKALTHLGLRGPS